MGLIFRLSASSPFAEQKFGRCASLAGGNPLGALHLRQIDQNRALIGVLGKRWILFATLVGVRAGADDGTPFTGTG